MFWLFRFERGITGFIPGRDVESMEGTRHFSWRGKLKDVDVPHCPQHLCIYDSQKKRIDEFAKIDSLVAQDIVEENNTEFLVELHEVISRLSPVDRALMLMWLEEINYEEIASTIGLPRNTVATRLRRAKEKIKKQFSF